MPELPEVETIVRDLRPPLRRAVIASVTLSRPDIVQAGATWLPRLEGAAVAGVSRRGKRIILTVKPAGEQARPASEQARIELVIHLGMSGRLTMEPAGAAIEPHTHLRIALAGRPVELRFRDPRRFGGIWLLAVHEGREATNESDRIDHRAGLGPLGPDALTIDAPRLDAVLARRRQIKALLLDQRALAGLGNIYADEALHRAGLHPLAIATDLDANQIARLARAIRQVLREALESGGSTLNDYRRPDGRSGGFVAQHRVYGREGQPCRRCKSTIVRILAAGRSSHVCPVCQPRRGKKTSIAVVRRAAASHLRTPAKRTDRRRPMASCPGHPA